MTGPNARRVAGGLLEALDAADDLGGPEYAALRALALAVAHGLDESLASGDLARLGSLSYRLTVLLRELRLTPDTRKQPESGCEVEDFLASIIQGPDSA